MLGNGAGAMALLLSLAAIAGCLAPGDGAPGEDIASTNVSAPANATAPVGTSISAFNETNRTETTGIGAMAHTHDYWGGMERKVVYTTSIGLIPLPLIPCKRPGCDADTAAGDADNYPLGTAIADFDIPAPPDGGLVYEGTERLEILFKDVKMLGLPQEPAHPYVHIGVDYLSAADEPYQFRPGPRIAPGQPAIIPVSPLEADMPHQTKSLWVFRVYTHEPNAFSFNLTITAVRGGAVADWPPHPDLYAERADRVVFDAPVKYDTKGGAQFWIDGSDDGWTYPHKVISWGTDSIDVTVSDVQFASASPAPPVGYQLEYHNASFVPKLGNGDLAGGRLKTDSAQGQTWTFHIPVDPQGYDTPYGQASRWGFRFTPQAKACALEGSVFGTMCEPFPYSMSYRLTIVAHGHSIDGAG